jgi:hypothetical protein
MPTGGQGIAFPAVLDLIGALRIAEDSRKPLLLEPRRFDGSDVSAKAAPLGCRLETTFHRMLREL